MVPLVPESHYDLLRDAIFDNNVDRVAELLKVEGVNVDHFDAGGQTLLHLASFWGRMGIVKQLLNAGASLKTKNAAGCTALDLATHWGHTSVAETIRLRGGKSVWEEKMGHFQVQVEDLRLQNRKMQEEGARKQQELESLRSDLDGLYRQLEEERASYTKATEQLNQLKEEHTRLRQDHEDTISQLASVTESYRAVMVEKARLEYIREEAERELTATLAHRDEILTAMQESVTKQEVVTKHWQLAEAAAAMADSQRNFVLGEKEKLQKQHTATLGELVVTTDRLHAAQDELRTLKVELAEYIFEKERDQRVLKRVAQVLTAKPMSSQDGLASQHTDSPEGTINRMKNFSKAARDYGIRLRKREQKKYVARQKRQEAVENQYLQEGLTTPIIDSEVFQQEFVSTLNAFATARQDKWVNLQHDRDRQNGFAKSVMNRAIATAPTRTRLRNEDINVNTTSRLPNPDVQTTLTPLRRKHSVNLDLYAEDTRPVTASAEQRLRGAFYTVPAMRNDIGPPSCSRERTLNTQFSQEDSTVNTLPPISNP